MNRFLIFLLLFPLLGCKPAEFGVRLGGSIYFLQDGDQSHVYITKMVQGRSVVAVDQMVIDHKIDGDFLFVLQKRTTSYNCQSKNGKVVIITIYTNRDSYWIIDMNASLEYGPFDIETYHGKAKSLGIAVPILNTPPGYFTNGDALSTAGSNCVAIEGTPIRRAN